jgi:hypothetical protein
MLDFVQRHGAEVIGVLSGFDRLLFRGTLRSISYGDGLDRFLGAMKVKYKDFGSFAGGLSGRIKDHAEKMATEAGRPFVYLHGSGGSKEQMASSIADRDKITDGLVCVLRCVEPCMSFSIRRDGGGKFRFVAGERKCLHLYFYFMDREFGLMHVRLATWLPFGIQVCLNGRGVRAARQLLHADRRPAAGAADDARPGEAEVGAVPGDARPAGQPAAGEAEPVRILLEPPRERIRHGRDVQGRAVAGAGLPGAGGPRDQAVGLPRRAAVPGPPDVPLAVQG